MRLITPSPLAVIVLTGCLTEIDDSDTQAQIDELTSRLEMVESENSALKEQLDEIKSDYLVSSDLNGYATMTWVKGSYPTGGVPQVLTDFAGYLQVDTSLNEVKLVGANVYIQSGSGYTDDNTTLDLGGDGTGSLTGLGNLIVGYAENSGSYHRTGSHTLVVGAEHDWSSFGGMVVGYENLVSGEYAVVAGGHDNTAAGSYTLTAGGTENYAEGMLNAVFAGKGNHSRATKYSGTAIFGGAHNTADGHNAAIYGGVSNTLNDNGHIAFMYGGHFVVLTPTKTTFQHN